MNWRTVLGLVSQRGNKSLVTIRGKDIPELRGSKGSILQKFFYTEENEGGRVTKLECYLIWLVDPREDLAKDYSNFLPNDETHWNKSFQLAAQTDPGRYVSLFAYDIRR